MDLPPRNSDESVLGNLEPLGRSTATLVTAQGHEISLEGMFNGRAAFLICGGPSLNKHDLNLLDRRGVLTFAVNNAAAVVRPNLWTCVDNPANFCEAIWSDPAIRAAPS